MLGKQNALSFKDVSAEQCHPGYVKPQLPPLSYPAVCHLLSHGKMTESLRLEKPFKVIEPNQSPSTAKATTQPSAPSTCLFNPSRDVHSPTALGSLCQGLTILSAKKCVLISNQNLPPASVSPWGLSRSHMTVSPQGLPSLFCPVLHPAEHSTATLCGSSAPQDGCPCFPQLRKCSRELRGP